MVNAGSLRLTFGEPNAEKKGMTVVQSSASSRGAAAALFPYTHNYWCEIDSKTLSSRYFHAIEVDSEESVETSNRYSPTEVVVSEVSTTLSDRRKCTESFAFSHGPARDMLSAILYIRSQTLAPGEEHTLLLLPFKSPYLLKVRVEAKEKHMGRDALRMSFAMTKIDRNTLTLKAYKKLKKPVTLWLSDDLDRVPLELRASVFIGDVRAVLHNHTKK